jgi:hypothetical protein
MRIVRVKYLAVAALLGLASCATLSEDACREGDWSQIGFRDGTNGRGADFIDQHTKACSRFAVTVNQSKWEAGRQEGLKRYCTTSNVYREGTNGRRLKSVCPIELQDRLELANDRGLIWRNIGQDISSAEREIRSINRLLATLPADNPSRGSLLSQRARLRLEILHLRARRIRYR